MLDKRAALTFLLEQQRSDGITQRAMAARIGITEQTWCHVRKGRRRLTNGQVIAACLIYPELWASLSQEAKAS